jgi:hypothetical protein
MAVNINKLGIRVDGWADLVEGAGGKEEQARQELEKMVRGKDMPDTSVSPTIISPTYGKKQRRYVVVEMPNGATVATYVGAFGKDLYAKWDVFVKPLLNMPVLYALLVIGAFFGLIGAFGKDFYGNTRFSFISLVATFLGWVIGGAILVAIAGFVARRNLLAFFFKQLDEFDLDDITALTIATHKAMLSALDVVGIKANILRMKEHFVAGTRDRLI